MAARHRLSDVGMERGARPGGRTGMASDRKFSTRHAVRFYRIVYFMIYGLLFNMLFLVGSSAGKFASSLRAVRANDQHVQREDFRVPVVLVLLYGRL